MSISGPTREEVFAGDCEMLCIVYNLSTNLSMVVEPEDGIDSALLFYKRKGRDEDPGFVSASLHNARQRDGAQLAVAARRRRHPCTSVYKRYRESVPHSYDPHIPLPGCY